MLKLDFFTQEEAKRSHRYTLSDINDLSIVAYGLNDIFEVLERYCFEVTDPKTENIQSIFPVLKILLDPIAEFLGKECPMQNEEYK
jgi:hypothetical protein